MCPVRLIAHRQGLATRAVALTFDDGPSQWTVRILDALRGAGARATFFVIGDAIAGREDVLRRMVAEGHEVANHTATHPRLDLLPSRTDLEHELRAASGAIHSVTGTAPMLFRPPGFHYTDEVLEVAGECGLGWVVLADVAMADFNETSSKKVAKKVLRRVRPGSIVVLHDGRPPYEPPPSEGGSLEDRSTSAGAIELLVPVLAERGFAMCTVSELIAL